MKRGVWRAWIGVGLLCVAGASVARGESAVGQVGFVVVNHMGGSLAVSIEHVESVFQFAAATDKPMRVRVNLPGADNKTVEGPEAEALWKALRDGHGAAFVWVAHMGGTLGIPVGKIQSAYKSANGDVRLNYLGDPQGKTVSAAEAVAVWSTLTHTK